jgi:cellobiose-specific phosphotransferase system component IIA
MPRKPASAVEKDFTAVMDWFLHSANARDVLVGEELRDAAQAWRSTAREAAKESIKRMGELMRAAHLARTKLRSAL